MVSNKEQIIELFYIKHIKPVDIAQKFNVSNVYITKVIKKDCRYIDEKNQRKQSNELRHKKYTNDYIKEKQKAARESYEILKYQLEKDTQELSYNYGISNRSFRKANSSAYHYNSKKKRFEIDRKLKVGFDVPKVVY